MKKFKWNEPDSAEDVKLYSKAFLEQAKKEGFTKLKLASYPSYHMFYLYTKDDSIRFHPLDGEQIAVEFNEWYPNDLEEILSDSSIEYVCFRSFKSAFNAIKKVVNKYQKEAEKVSKTVLKQIQPDE